MKVRNFILADAVSRGDGKLYIHGAGITSIDAGDFPYTHPRLGMLITLVREDERLGGTHRILVELTTANGERVATLLETEIQLPGEEARSDQPLVANLLGEFAGLVFPTRSRYWLVLSVDDQELDRLPVAVGTPPPIETAAAIRQTGG
jgi:hypothetical protein